MNLPTKEKPKSENLKEGTASQERQGEDESPSCSSFYFRVSSCKKKNVIEEKKVK